MIKYTQQKLGIGKMNKATQEYLEWIENLPKNSRDPERINWAILFEQAQNGDMDALNYLYETNEYIIHEIISEATQFINPDLDIQVYLDMLTDVLIRGIKDYDPSHSVSFRPFVKRNMFAKLRDHSEQHIKLQRVLNTTSPISEYDIPTNEEKYPLANDVSNTAYDYASFSSYLEEPAIENASILWNKLKVFFNDNEIDLLFKHYVDKRSLKNIANEYNCSAEYIRIKINNALNRIKKLIKFSTITYTHLNVDKLPIQELYPKINTKDIFKVSFYNQVYKYLFLDEPIPHGSNAYGYLSYEATKVQNKSGRPPRKKSTTSELC